MCQYEIKDLKVVYGKADSAVEAVKDISLNIERGEIVSIVGKSGAGKSTVLNVMGGIERPTSGSVVFNGEDIGKLSEKKLSEIRLKQIGTVYQGCYLVSTLTVRDNICLPSVCAYNKFDKEWLNELTEKLGISERLTHMPNQLSGGEKQRVAIARALMNRPEVILADEPTGNLDSVNGKSVFELLISCAKEYGNSLIYVTHDDEKALLADRKYVMKDGAFVE